MSPITNSISKVNLNVKVFFIFSDFIFLDFVNITINNGDFNYFVNIIILTFFIFLNHKVNMDLFSMHLHINQPLLSH